LTSPLHQQQADQHTAVYSSTTPSRPSPHNSDMWEIAKEKWMMTDAQEQQVIC